MRRSIAWSGVSVLAGLGGSWTGAPRTAVERPIMDSAPIMPRAVRLEGEAGRGFFTASAAQRSHMMCLLPRRRPWMPNYKFVNFDQTQNLQLLAGQLRSQVLIPHKRPNIRRC